MDIFLQSDFLLEDSEVQLLDILSDTRSISRVLQWRLFNVFILLCDSCSDGHFRNHFREHALNKLIEIELCLNDNLMISAHCDNESSLIR